MMSRLPAPSARLLGVALLLGAAVGEIAWRWADLGVIANASGALAGVVASVTGFIWAVRGHWRTEVDLLASLSMNERRTADAIARQIDRKTALLIVATLVLFGAGLLPFASRQLAGAIWHWMAPLAGASVGAGLSCAYIALTWRDAFSRMARERRTALEQEARDAALIVEATRNRPDAQRLDEGWAQRPPRRIGAPS